MVNESFRKIKVPRIRYSSEEEFATLAPFDESATIGVIVYPVKGKEKSFDVWVMKDYWDEGSWVKQYTCEPVEAIYKLVGFYGSKLFLWSSCNDGLGWLTSITQLVHHGTTFVPIGYTFSTGMFEMEGERWHPIWCWNLCWRWLKAA
ncbi:NAD(P)H dehydrogenase (quinone) FQR 1 [Spatholobus suberectus]|nr:NAD(P)H dehydrogenase (quinone) FQR 1 [Spatholobus suberectus]